MGPNATLAGFAFTFAGVLITVVVGPLVQRLASRNRSAERDASAASAVSTLAEAMEALQGENRRLRDIQTEMQTEVHDAAGEASTAHQEVRRLRGAFDRHLLLCTTPDDLRAAMNTQQT